MKRVVLVHGWESGPQYEWFPWLSAELKQRGFEVVAPQLPGADQPRPDTWVRALSEAVGAVDSDTYFVGHSLGCQAIARYLLTLPENTKAGGAVFVAGFFRSLSNLETDDETQETARLWFKPFPLQDVKRRLGRSIAIFSDDDPWVPLDNREDFEEGLDSEIMVVPGQGHFSGLRDRVYTAPVILEALLKITEPHKLSFEREKLAVLEGTGEYVFHGSMDKLSVLEPRQAHNYVDGEHFPDGEPAVFASSNADYAIFMAIINERNCPEGFHGHAGYSGKDVKLSATKETLEQLKNDAYGFVHVFDRGFFSSRDGNDVEFVSFRSVRPIEVIRVIKQDLPANIKPNAE